MQLESAFRRWIESVNVTTFEQLVEIVMIEQFVSNLPNEVRLWLLDHTPSTLNQAARFADEFVAIHNPNGTNFKRVLTKTSLAVTTNETDVNSAGNNYRDTYQFKNYGNNRFNTKDIDKRSEFTTRCWKCFGFEHIRKNVLVLNTFRKIAQLRVTK